MTALFHLTAILATLGFPHPLQRASATPSKPDPLIQGFLNPPPESRMRMYWRVFGPAWTREGIDYQLKQLKDVGVGGVMLMPFYPVAVDDTAKKIHNQQFLSKEFLDTFGYAARKAKELGLRFSVQGGSGWPFGGPTVTLQDAAQRIRRSEVKPRSDGLGYELPALRDGERILAAWRGAKRLDPARLVGFARRSEDRHFEGAAASSKFYDVDTRLRNPAAWAWPHRDAPDFSVARDCGTCSYREALLRNDGLPNAVGNRMEQLTLFITGPTGMKVKRPALGADGYVVDHYRTEPLIRWLDANVKPLLDAAPGLVESIFCDSLEVYNSNWTSDLPEQFKKRRGYDLIPRLPELFDEKAAASPDLRFDFWRTLAEIHEERWTKPLGEWSRKHGVKLEMEEYGTPPSPLTAYKHIDIPTGEQYEWMGFSFSRYAASGAHLAGKRVIGAEAWTWTGLPNRLIDSLKDLKLASDYHFLAGINDLTGVDFAYSPPDIAPPSWLPYFGPVMNQNNPQWPYFKYLVQYVNRCQWLLRQGKPVAQVALYLPVEQSFAHGPIEQMPLDFLLRDHFVTGEKTGEFGLDNARKHRSELIHTLITHGYNFDGIDFWTLIREAKIKNGKLICGDGEYSIVILPNLEGMELEALEKLGEFVRQGGILIAVKRWPSRTFGTLSRARTNDKSFRRLVEKIKSGLSAQAGATHKYGRGRIEFIDEETLFNQSLLVTERERLRGLNPYWQPGDRPGSGLLYLHRQLGDRHIYFASNLGAETINDQWEHAFIDTDVDLLDPELGSVPHGVVTRTVPRAVQLNIHYPVPPGGSFFLVTRPVMSTASHSVSAVSQQNSSKQMIARSWRITFSGPDAPSPVKTDTLTSWTQYPQAKYFSGQATYETTFDWNEPVKGSIYLRFTEVHEAGEVWLNGKLAGGIWTPPYEVEIGKLLKQGKNTLKVTVGNLMLNRFLGLPSEDLRPLRAAYGNRFPDPEEKKITKEPPPSGLIGPVEIIRE